MIKIAAVVRVGVIPGMRGRRIWMNRLDLMRLSFWFICTLRRLDSADDSFLFTLEEFGREVLFLLDTVEEVSFIHH
jgi:hypothetical protein